ncbi:Amyotrophic lateral sclerosis 2 chromosomal region candidate gene 12 protein-like protein [Trichoplax sp. H2]|nr:Amyotrophic lateral sclerosis 2 chromosomal region candidate gene 12 protein-like protein [Trichoplax sp. H2]|eukprot:RDD38302.1 Amyotrophic lateral sclerosis 2 chromosomal region candidate gene 12 protein-like protein [Trichoplax sp. H2]
MASNVVVEPPQVLSISGMGSKSPIISKSILLNSSDKGRARPSTASSRVTFGEDQTITIPSRPHTAKAQCRRFAESPVRRPLSSTYPRKRQINYPQFNKTVIGKGYTLSKEDRYWKFTIDSNKFFGKSEPQERKSFRSLSAQPKYFYNSPDLKDDRDSPTDIPVTDRKEERKSSPVTSARQYTSHVSFIENEKLMIELQEQVSELNLLLEQERRTRDVQLEEAQLRLDEVKSKLKLEHEDDILVLKLQSEKTLQTVQEQHIKEMDDLEKTLKEEIESIKSERQFLQAAFDSYKTQISIEMDEKWTKREIELKQHERQTVERELARQKEELTKEKRTELATLARQGKMELEAVRHDHKAELEDTENEGLKLHSKLREAEDQIFKLRSQVVESRTKLKGYEDNFQEKVIEVEEKFKQKIHTLMADNTLVRKRLMEKCDELVRLKTDSEQKQETSRSYARKTLQAVIHARNKAALSLVSQDTKKDPSVAKAAKQSRRRRSSMPVTPLEQQISVFKAKMKSTSKLQESIALSEDSDSDAPYRSETAASYDSPLKSSSTGARNIQSAGSPIPATLRRKARRPSLQVSVLKPDSS